MSSVLLAVLMTVLPEGLSPDDTVEMDRGVQFHGLELPKQAVIGERVPIDFYYSYDEPLDTEWNVFLHMESRGEENCRIVFDRPPTQVADGMIHHHVEPPVSPECKPGRLEIYSGIFNTQTGERLRNVDPPTMDDRVHSGWISLVREKTDEGTRAIAPSNMKVQRVWALVRPWTGWLLAVLFMAVLAVALRMRWKFDGSGLLVDRGPRAKAWTGVLFIPLILGILVALDFVKDDAYISFRYAHNLATGHGLVFNPGERLEGFTNFLWTIMMALWELLGADPFQVCEIIGTALCFGMLAALTLTVMYFNGGRTNASHLWAGMWIATSSSMALWSTSGMEQPLAMFLPMTSVYLLWKGQEDGKADWGMASGVLMGLGCMTRPEIHLIGMIVGVTLLGEMAVRRKLDRVALGWIACIFAVIVPFHLFRYLYYGSLKPNTYFVKTGASIFLMVKGLDKVRDMFSFNNTGILLVLAPLAFLEKRRLKEKLVVLAIALSFMAYIIKVGIDEMRWHRLYLPALPFLALLAGLGLQNVCDMLSSMLRTRKQRLIPYIAGWVLVMLAASLNFTFTVRQMAGLNGRGDLAGTFHPDLGKFLTRHERPGALVAFQDMGSTPYHAPDIDFFDFIGLTEGKVARARFSYGLNAYTATENYRNQDKYDTEMRDHYFERNPEWAILTIYVPIGSADRVERLFMANPSPSAFLGYEHNNSYQFKITRDQRFQDGYVHVRTWPRSRTYYLALYRRKDLWEQVPGEVVLDGPPEGIGGVQAKFEGGLEMLGSEMETETIERHEIFITTWWKVPGPLESDVQFFIHAEKEGHRTAYDHYPGDWMYPADRWRPGDIIEDRTLFQIPVPMKPGTYSVYIGAYHRSTGQRLDVLEGQDDGEDRLFLGTLKVKHMLPLVHHTIPLTDIEEQRKYPDLIIDSGR